MQQHTYNQTVLLWRRDTIEIEIKIIWNKVITRKSLFKNDLNLLYVSIVMHGHGQPIVLSHLHKICTVKWQ